MPSPIRDAIPAVQHTTIQSHTDLQVPPSPRTHRALRRLQSAHTLGARAAASSTTTTTSSSLSHQPSLITQQRLREQQRNVSPTRNPSTSRSPQRIRANSDATPPLVSQMNSVSATKRAGQKKPVFSLGHLTLQQILRDGPADGDFMGALESARWKVVDEGVKSAEGGMVQSNCCVSAQLKQMAY